MKLTGPELDELLGAFALNAVDSDERQVVEEYLLRSPRAAAEVADHVFVATALAGSKHEVPAPSWDRISAAIDKLDTKIDITSGSGSESVAAIRPIDSAKSQRRTGSWIMRSVAAAAAVAVVGLGVQSFRQSSRLSNLRNDLAVEKLSTKAKEQELKRIELQDNFNIERVLREPGTRVAQLKQDKKPLGQVLLDSKGRGFLIVTADKQLPANKAYQLWGVNGKSAISLGVMKSGVAAMPLSAAGDWNQFVLTVETLPGVVTSAGPAVASGTFS
jgi:hypothetical protein